VIAADIGIGSVELGYSGLGALLYAEGLANTLVEDFRTDALGSVLWTRDADMVDGINRTKMHTYNTATGQLVSSALGTPGTSNCPLYNQSCHPSWYLYEYAQEFDQSGNVKASYEIETDVASQEAAPTETRHYYDAAERLTYSNTMRGFIWWAGTGFGTFSDYRYDALGRRVLSRTRRVEATCAVPCDAFVERTVYDGDQVLAEIRSSGQIGASASVLKADGVAAQNGQTSGWTDSRYPELFGIVLYAHGLGIDAPVHVLKRHPNGSWAGFTPLEDWRGSYWGGRRTNGSSCDSTCPAEWPSGAVNAFGRELGIEPTTYTTWHGSLIRGRKDANGLTYLRNRYYDPTTGQFTQPDPIGLAGGLNAYGFAAGDPINYADPFGLRANLPDAESVDSDSDSANPCESNPDSMDCKRFQRLMAVCRADARQLASTTASWMAGLGVLRYGKAILSLVARPDLLASPAWGRVVVNSALLGPTALTRNNAMADGGTDYGFVGAAGVGYKAVKMFPTPAASALELGEAVQSCAAAYWNQDQ
jgi:RHS repeat-associated protein